MIRFPSAELLAQRARELRVPLPVIVRDLARIVEILNLGEHGFFADDSVLAGGMALRCYGSQRLTIYDADLSTRAVTAPGQMRKMLSYTSDEIEINPAQVVPTSDQGNVWRSDPVDFDPLWLTIPIEEGERRFKVDLASYGVMQPGADLPLSDPYELGLWPGRPPSIMVMRLEEIAAEKTLGWCAHRLYKHLADLAFIAERLSRQINRPLLRELTVAKLDLMRGLQPNIYGDLRDLADLLAALRSPGPIVADQQRGVQFLRNPHTPTQVVRLVRERYVPMLEA